MWPPRSNSDHVIYVFFSSFFPERFLKKGREGKGTCTIGDVNDDTFYTSILPTFYHSLDFAELSDISIHLDHECILCFPHHSTKTPRLNHSFKSTPGWINEVNADDHGNWTQDLGSHPAMSGREWNPMSRPSRVDKNFG